MFALFSFKKSIAIILWLLGTYLLVAEIAFFFTGLNDASVIDAYLYSHINTSHITPSVHNPSGLWGAYLAHYFIFEGLGISALWIPLCLLATAFHIHRPQSLPFVEKYWLLVVLLSLYVNIFWGFFVFYEPQVWLWGALAGHIGYSIVILFDHLLGWGSYVLLCFLFVVTLAAYLGFLRPFYATVVVYFSKKTPKLFKSRPVPLVRSRLSKSPRTHWLRTH